MKTSALLIVGGLLLALTAVALAGGGNIANTKHNLSAGGPGAVRATGESMICIFCHTPHNAAAQVPMWNRSDTTAFYDLYDSSTFDATPAQPNGSSRLCLSCHDGTIALGMVKSRTTPISMAGGVSTIPSGWVQSGKKRGSNLGTNLADDHPISFVFNNTLAAADGELADPGSLPPAVRLDAAGRLQCTTCHDPHNDQNNQFLVVNNEGSALCTACHQVDGWEQSPHRNSTSGWNGSGEGPWGHTDYTTVAQNGCLNCHDIHSANNPQRLLAESNEEDTCLVCHDGSLTTQNVLTDFNKPYAHDVGATLGVHDPTEQPLLMSAHVECSDCHDPHRSYEGATGAAPSLPPNQTGASGVRSSGSAIASVTRDYEVCYKCHGDNSVIDTPDINREIAQTNTRLEFSTANPSYHPIQGSGRNSDVPSLIAPLTTSSIIRCTDCHASNSGSTGAPHGSTHRYLLVAHYSTADNTSESAGAYALCYRCHSRTNILNDVSFDKHKKHIEGERAPCSACHDSHGISSSQGNTTNNAKLINFDTDIVFPNSTGQLGFRSTGFRRGECDLDCHGEDHKSETYKP